MSRPIQEKSISGATSTTSGSQLDAGGRVSFGLFVVMKNADTANDTVDVQLEVSHDGTNWASPRDEDGNQIGQLTISDAGDPGGTGDASAYLYIHGMPARFVRARITSFTDAAGSDLTVDAYVVASNNPAKAYDYREV